MIALVTAGRIAGRFEGRTIPHTDFPRILNLYANGTLDLDSMITRRLALEEINDAFEAIRAGEAVRTLIIHGD